MEVLVVPYLLLLTLAQWDEFTTVRKLNPVGCDGEVIRPIIYDFRLH